MRLPEAVTTLKTHISGLLMIARPAGVKDDVAFGGGGKPTEEGGALLFALDAGALLVSGKVLVAYKITCS
ncbi:MAG TPA: hypothetical protein VHF46_02140 [Rubrobacteraceae bacterium]|nr:hypothetical protein [Rubrobacteraceae bacterium]